MRNLGCRQPLALASSVLLFVLSLLAWPASADRLTTGKASAAGMDAQRLTRIAPQMQQLVDAKRVAGVVTIGARRNKIVHFEAVGHKDAERGMPMRKDTIFRIYSMSKPVTGVALMMLYEEGKFSLSDPLSKYIPAFANPVVYTGTDDDGNLLTEPAKQAITIRHIMTHTAGLAYGTMMGNHPIDVAYSQADIFNPDATLAQFSDKVANIPLKWQPGTIFNYSAAVEIQGHLVEILSGQRFGDFLAERLFKPLGMKDSGFYVPADKLDRFAQVYQYDANGQMVAGELFDGVIRFTEDQQLQAGGWGLVSTAMDYLRFTQMLVNGGELDGVRILSPSTVKLMHTNHLPAGVTELPLALGGQPASSFGLDFAIIEDPVENGTAYTRGEYFWGGAAGTWFWIDPVEDLVFVGMVQQLMGQPQFPDLRGISKRAFYSAIMELNQP